MNKKIIIQIPFNVYGHDCETDKGWIDYRLKIFTDYTLKSLMAQTNQYFTLLFRCREETIPYIKDKIGKLLPDNIIIVGKSEYGGKIKELIKDFNYLYIVRLDSDDMYINTFIDTLQNYNPKPETEVLINQGCYSYDIYQKRLAYRFRLSPPSHALIYRVEDYMKGSQYILKKGHCGAILLKHEIILGINWLNTIHKRNTASYFEHKSGEVDKWEEIKGADKIKNILKEFGLEGENK